MHDNRGHTDTIFGYLTYLIDSGREGPTVK